MLRKSCIVLLSFFSVSAFAEGFDYTFVQATYGRVDFDDLNVDGDGFGIDGSMAVHENFHLFAGYQFVGLDFDVDASELNAGIGFNTPISPNMDFVAQLAFVRAEVEVPLVGSDSENGWGIGVGIRAKPIEQLEVNVGVNHVDFGSDGGDDTALGAGFLYSFTDSFAAGLSGSWGDETSAYQIGGRFYF